MKPGRDWHLAKLKIGGLIAGNVLVIAGAFFAGAVGGMNVTRAEQDDGSRLVNQYSTGLSIVSGIITTLHWIPQIIEAWTLQQLGLISLLTLLMQYIGSVLTAFNLIGTSDWASQWYIPVPYLLAAVMMGLVVAVSSFFALRLWRLRRRYVLRGGGGSSSAAASLAPDEEEYFKICEGEGALWDTSSDEPEGEAPTNDLLRSADSSVGGGEGHDLVIGGDRRLAQPHGRRGSVLSTLIRID